MRGRMRDKQAYRRPTTNAQVDRGKKTDPHTHTQSHNEGRYSRRKVFPKSRYKEKKTLMVQESVKVRMVFLLNRRVQ